TLMAVAFEALPNDTALQDFQSGKQCGGSVTFVVVRHCAATSLLHTVPNIVRTLTLFRKFCKFLPTVCMCPSTSGQANLVYRVESFLAAGGMQQVFRANDT